MQSGYSIYGLHVQVDASIPHLAPIENSATPDARVWLRAAPPRLDGGAAGTDASPISDNRAQETRPSLAIWRTVDEQWWRLTYRDGTEFTVRGDGSDVWARWADPNTLDDAAIYLLGPVLGLVLRLKGVTCLHASCVNIEGRAVAFLGAAGSGKSTLAAAFAQAGYAVLSEDVLALTDLGSSFLVRPGYPLIRLWPASVSSLFHSSDALPRLTPTWDKRGLALGTHYKFTHQPTSLHAIYVLGARRRVAAPAVTAMRPRDRILALLANTYGGSIADTRMRRAEFRVLPRIAMQVPMRRLTPHADPSRISRLCDRIVEDVRSRSADGLDV